MRIALIVGLGLLMLVGGHFLLSWFASRRRVRVGRVGGAVVMRLARGRNIALGGLALIPAILFAMLPLAMRESTRTPGALAFAVATAIVAFGVSAYFFAAEFRKRVRVDDAGLERVGVFTRRRLAWGDVAQIGFNQSARWFFLVGKDGTRIWVYESFEGVGDFAEVALQHLPPAVIAAGLYVREELEDLAAV